MSEDESQPPQAATGGRRSESGGQVDEANVAYPGRPRCKCICGECRRRPGRRVACGICHHLVGPGCCLHSEHPPRCHICARLPAPDPQEEPTSTAAGVRRNEGGGGVTVFPQFRRETLPEASLTYPSSAVVGEGTDLILEETPTKVEDPEVDEWTKHLVTKDGKTYFPRQESSFEE